MIVAVLAIIFLWGPGKLPEMAKSIGRAKAEYDKAVKQATSLTDLSSITNTLTNPSTPSTPSEAPVTPPPTVQAPEDPIVVAARSLGINTEGKTKEDLSKEILTRATKTGGQPGGT